MILLLLLACDAPDPGDDTSAPSITLTSGLYTVEAADTWEGDCEFDDMATYDAPEQEWLVDPRGDVLILYPDYWTPLSCSLVDGTFQCDDGSWEGGRMQVTRLFEGTFIDDSHIEGARVIELDCGGAGCDDLKESYGRHLDFPCRAEAPFSGVRE